MKKRKTSFSSTKEESISKPDSCMDQSDCVSNSDDNYDNDKLEGVNSDEANENQCTQIEKSKENLAWADAMAKILKTNKPKRRKTIVLSRAKRANEIKTPDSNCKAEIVGFEIEGEIKASSSVKSEFNQIETTKEENLLTRLKKKDWASKGYVKPNILEKDREKALLKTATRGVVQLFNSVREYQKTLEKDLGDAGPLEHKKDKVLKSLDKRAFLDVLMGSTKSQPVSNLIPKEIKEDPENPTWSILRDDFMMSSKLKDWDKEGSVEVKNDPD